MNEEKKNYPKTIVDIIKLYAFVISDEIQK